MVRAKRRELKSKQERENAMNLAMKMVSELDSEGKRNVSLRDAAEVHGIAFSTLRGHLIGTTTQVLSHQHLQLSPADEYAVVRWIGGLEREKFSPRIEHIRQAASLIAGHPVGKNWVPRFLDRHPKLATCSTDAMEKDQVDAVTPQVIRTHFRDVQGLRNGVEPRDTWNMNEKGFLIGLKLATRSKGICTYQQVNFPIAGGNREILTWIEAVSADGTALPPLIIYKGTAHYLGWHRFIGSQAGREDFYFSYSKHR